jgi:hypothetical protein
MTKPKSRIIKLPPYDELETIGIWRSIDTAPKDGTWIFVCWKELACGCPDLDEWLPGMKIVRWYDDAWYFCSEYSIGGKPTHWMPLPKPPIKQ